MAILKPIITSTKSSDSKCIKYICQDEKTEKQKYVTTINCSLVTVNEEFSNTRNLYEKNGGILYHHFVQSHPKGYEIEPALANKIAVDFAKNAFKGHECVVATHVDRDHTHSHILLNAVNAETGTKLHWHSKELCDLRDLSDSICQKYGLPVMEKAQRYKRSNGIPSSEYHCAMEAKSWKINLISEINRNMASALTRQSFILLMNNAGYDVLWEDDLKFITYTCPDGHKCRDNKLHDDRYYKENMENEFEIRKNVRSIQSEFDREIGSTVDDMRSGTRAGCCDISGETAYRNAYRDKDALGYDCDNRANGSESEQSGCYFYTDERRNDEAPEEADGMIMCQDKDDKSGNDEIIITGWEAERSALIRNERARREKLRNEERIKHENLMISERKWLETLYSENRRNKKKYGGDRMSSDFEDEVKRKLYDDDISQNNEIVHNTHNSDRAYDKEDMPEEKIKESERKRNRSFRL